MTNMHNFPQNIFKSLRDSGYTALTVGKDYGGEGISLYDMLLFQERLAKGDGPTALSIGWHLSVMGELAEGNSWDRDVFSSLSHEALKGALINRAASEAQTGKISGQEEDAPEPMQSKRTAAGL